MFEEPRVSCREIKVKTDEIKSETHENENETGTAANKETAESCKEDEEPLIAKKSKIGTADWFGPPRSKSASRYGPPGQSLLADLDPLSRIWFPPAKTLSLSGKKGCLIRSMLEVNIFHEFCVTEQTVNDKEMYCRFL